MFGEQHRDAALHHQALDQGDQLVALARRHAGGRLVHQQQPRLVGERNGELDALDVAIGEFAAGRSAASRMPTCASSSSARARAATPPDATARRSRARARSAPSARSRPPSSSRTSRRPGTCGRRRAARCCAARARRDCSAFEPDLAGVRRKLAVDHVEAGRLAGAVRADHGKEFAVLHVEAHVVDGAHAAE